MRCQLVISRYRESLEWVAELPHPAIVYDKGPCPLADAVTLPNVGFEGQTFLHHFATHYDELADVSVCLQGDPFPHLRHGVEMVLAAVPLERITFLPMARHSSWQDPAGNPHHPGLGEANDRLWRAFKGHGPPNLWFSWYGGQFAVHRDLVRRHSREFWQRAASLVVSKNDACALERLWGHLLA
jgi:hypothetical protein